MTYSFVRNDENSFSSISRVYEVYKGEELITCLVIGIDSMLDKYFITMLGDNMLSSKYGLDYDSISSIEFVAVLYDFFNNAIDFFTREDLVPDDTFYEKFVPLKRYNFVFYSSNIEPYYNEDLGEYDGVYSPEDNHTNFLLDIGIITPIWMEDPYKEEYVPYTTDNALDIEDEFGLYSGIKFDLLEKEYQNAKEILENNENLSCI